MMCNTYVEGRDTAKMWHIIVKKKKNYGRWLKYFKINNEFFLKFLDFLLNQIVS